MEFGFLNSLLVTIKKSIGHLTDSNDEFWSYINPKAGAIAGTAVDSVLFPLDTIKTRLQSREGFKASGGFTRIYAGMSSAMLGSAPSAATFFVTYEFIKSTRSLQQPAVIHMVAASAAEMVYNLYNHCFWLLFILWSLFFLFWRRLVSVASRRKS